MPPRRARGCVHETDAGCLPGRPSASTRRRSDSARPGQIAFRGPNSSSDVDIDHVIALAEAWTSGASSWTTTRRQQFANSLGDGQLIAVTDNVNSSKSDRDAAEWQPPRLQYHCMFAKHVVHVKYSWGLSMDGAEKAAIGDMLATC
jgi:hypothetical protein